MEAFKKRQITFLLQLIGISILLFGAHKYMLHYFAGEIEFFFPLWHIYLFHLIITLVVYSIINYRYSFGKTDVFNVFMVMTFLKMIFAILFLLPLILSKIGNKQPDVFNFFFFFFLYLFFEVYAITKFLQKG